MKNNKWTLEFNGVCLEMQNSEGVFSPYGIDKGTMAMLSCVDFSQFNRVLDLGCGGGIIGIIASKCMKCNEVVMVDKYPEAVKCAKENCMRNGCQNVEVLVSDGLTNLKDRTFDLILSNPPYHEDFSVPKRFIEDGYRKLEDGGYIYMVTKRKKWYKNKLIHVFGGVKIIEKDGYYVFCSQKINRKKNNNNNEFSQKNMSKKIRRKMERKKGMM